MVRGLSRGASGCAVASHSTRSSDQIFTVSGMLFGASVRRRLASARINSRDVNGTLPPSINSPAICSAGRHSQGRSGSAKHGGFDPDGLKIHADNQSTISTTIIATDI
jgi:hypothetical protein